MFSLHCSIFKRFMEWVEEDFTLLILIKTFTLFFTVKSKNLCESNFKFIKHSILLVLSIPFKLEPCSIFFVPNRYSDNDQVFQHLFFLIYGSSKTLFSNFTSLIYKNCFPENINWLHSKYLPSFQSFIRPSCKILNWCRFRASLIDLQWFYLHLIQRILVLVIFYFYNS